MKKTIVLTGVTRGLGKALAGWFIENGYIVIGCGRSRSEIEALSDRYPDPHRFDSLDVCDADAVERWAAEVIEAAGPPDLLVNNAAIITPNAPLWDVPVADFSRILDVNVKGVFHVIRGFLPSMIARGSGVVVNFSSGWGRSVSPEVAPYCATKWGIEGLTLALAEELPSGMAAIPLNPGIIDTEMLRSCFGENAASFPSPDVWVQRAGPMLLRLNAADNGKPLTVS